MPVKIVYPDHIEIMGVGRVLLTSSSSSNSLADQGVGQIAEEAALTSRVFAVFVKPTQAPSEVDVPRSHDQDLRKGIEGFLAEDGIRYILEIEGKIEPGVEIAMTGGQTCSDSTLVLVRSRLEKQFTVNPSELQGGVHSDGLATSYSRKNEKGEFLVESVRIVFGSEERQFRKEKVISVISEIADLLNARVGPSLTD